MTKLRKIALAINEWFYYTNLISLEDFNVNRRWINNYKT